MSATQPTFLTADAILSPIGHAGSGDASTRLGRLQIEFAPVLRTPRVFVRHQGQRTSFPAPPTTPFCSPKPTPGRGNHATSGPTAATAFPWDGSPRHARP